jgi:hypothetical protein
MGQGLLVLPQLLRDGRLDWLDWDPVPRLRRVGRLGRPEFSDIPPPGEHEHWLHVQIRWDESEIYDDFEEIEDRPRARRSEWRTLWVDEAGLEEALREYVTPAGEKAMPRATHKSRIGRPSLAPEIEAAYTALAREKAISSKTDRPTIRRLIRRRLTSKEEPSKNLGDQAIDKALRSKLPLNSRRKSKIPL